MNRNEHPCHTIKSVGARSASNDLPILHPRLIAVLLAVVILIGWGCQNPATPPGPVPTAGEPADLVATALIARAKALELPTAYEPPPGDALAQHTAGFANYLIRLGVEARGEDYHAFPQRALFDKLGIRPAA